MSFAYPCSHHCPTCHFSLLFLISLHTGSIDNVKWIFGGDRLTNSILLETVEYFDEVLLRGAWICIPFCNTILSTGDSKDVSCDHTFKGQMRRESCDSGLEID